ncbi:MAG: hypothetical protein AAFV53_01635 [Myxococcota bacterium]
MLLTLLLLSAASRADDPWLRPQHLRAIGQPPAAWADLDADRQRVRLWWDATDDDPGLTVQALINDRWRVLTDDARPGWISEPLPVGTAFRLRQDGPQARWTAPIAADPWTSPTDFARMAGPDDALLGMGVGQLASDGQRAWASTLYGGAAITAPNRAAVTPLTRWDGLPDDRVISVDAHADGRALIGTANGAVLFDGDAPVRVWDDVLPDPYVQSVLIGENALWLGTYRGLSRVTEDTITPILTPWSVFSLSETRSGEVWVGYEGLRLLSSEGVPLIPPAEAQAALDEDEADIVEEEAAPVVDPLVEDLLSIKAYDTEITEEILWIGTGSRGLLQLKDGQLTAIDGYPSETIYGVSNGPLGLWAAADGDGLAGPGGVRLGRADGLPSNTVWTIAAQERGMWIGTDLGLTWAQLSPLGDVKAILPRPLSDWPADLEAQTMILTDRGAFFAGPRGVWSAGDPHPFANNLTVSTIPPVAALLEMDDEIWAVGRSVVRMDRDGRLHRDRLPERATAAVVSAGTAWIASDNGLWRYDRTNQRFVSASDLEGITRLRADERSIWAVARGGIVHRVVLGAARPFSQIKDALDLAPAGDSVCVGTTDGLERLWIQTGAVDDVLESLDANVEIPAVAADAQGRCWFAAEDGTVGRVGLDGAVEVRNLPSPDAPRARALVLDGDDAVWVMTAAGTYRVRF